MVKNHITHLYANEKGYWYNLLENNHSSAVAAAYEFDRKS